MYTVYLVDDEKWALYDVVHTCPFAEMGFEILGQNTNPVSAMDEILKCRPDVVFADIRMPSLSGIDLIHMVRKQLPDTIFIILSGYAEFEYAASALRLGVFDYCLKPMNDESARDLLARLHAHLAGRPVEEKGDSVDEFSSENAQFSTLLRYVNAHINEPLALGELAQRFFINVSYCGELFKSVTGETFTQYVRKRRIQQACELLQRTSLPMSQVAARVGYADLPYFSRLFTASMGISPSRYRRESKK